MANPFTILHAALFGPNLGTPGVGKVLTSDATGLGTWQSPSSGSSSADVAFAFFMA